MVKRTLLLCVGAVVFVAGVLLFPLPGPFGIPTMVIGWSIMLKASGNVKRITIRYVHKNRISSRLWRKMRGFFKQMRSGRNCHKTIK